MRAQRWQGYTFPHEQDHCEGTDHRSRWAWAFALLALQALLGRDLSLSPLCSPEISALKETCPSSLLSLSLSGSHVCGKAKLLQEAGFVSSECVLLTQLSSQA